MWEIFRNFSDI